MSCCTPADGRIDAQAGEVPDPAPWVRRNGDGSYHLDLMVPGIHCAGCISRIERKLMEHAAVAAARVNMSTKRVSIDWHGEEALAGELAGRIASLGYQVRPFDGVALAATQRDPEGAALLRSLAVTGFAAGNIMLLSVSVWSGAEDATRDLFHWISALIALPAIAYGGRVFFASAWSALRQGGLNMDVPISLAVVLAAAMSFYETAQGGAQAYFDASVTLLFFLLIGRYLDHLMRARARSAVTQLLALNATGATVVEANGRHHFSPIGDLEAGMLISVAAGERIPVDGIVTSGRSDLDRSLVTGESLPVSVSGGDQIQAGVLNLSGPLIVQVSATGEDTFLAEVVRLMEQAERGKARYVALADRVARIYAPAVHVLAGGTFLAWLLLGSAWDAALLNAIAVLIVTCPCALGLAVPVVQVVASGVLFRAGIMVKDGAALERLAQVDTIVFDKTGTLTQGKPELIGTLAADDEVAALAASLASGSRHPLCRALSLAAQQAGVARQEMGDMIEHPGQGLEALWQGRTVRLGRRGWCGAATQETDAALEMWLAVEGSPPRRFAFVDKIRPGAKAVLRDLRDLGYDIELLSGDRWEAAKDVAAELGIGRVLALATPADKVRHVEGLGRQGHRVLMIGDGINDAPALAAAHVSMSPGSAADVSQTAANFVFLGEDLASVTKCLQVARVSVRLIRENFALAFAYNLVAVPVAMVGLVSPLIAAIAMSSSSMLVTGNALRLRLSRAVMRGGAEQARSSAIARQVYAERAI